jgi:hypothetical protein
VCRKKKVPARTAFPQAIPDERSNEIPPSSRVTACLGQNLATTPSICLRASVAQSDWNDREAKGNVKAPPHSSQSSPDLEGIPDSHRKSRSILAGAPRNTQSIKEVGEPLWGWVKGTKALNGSATSKSQKKYLKMIRVPATRWPAFSIRARYESLPKREIASSLIAIGPIKFISSQNYHST